MDRIKRILFGSGCFLGAVWSAPVWSREHYVSAEEARAKIQRQLKRFGRIQKPAFIPNDADAIASDWQKVGLDMRNAINEYAAETR